MMRCVFAAHQRTRHYKETPARAFCEQGSLCIEVEVLAAYSHSTQATDLWLCRAVLSPALCAQDGD